MLKIVFMGTPNFSVKILDALIEHGYKILFTVTKEDALKGRKKELVESPVKIYSNNNNIKCITPKSLKEIIPLIKEVKPDLIITAAFGKFIPDEIIKNFLTLNVHASLLPKYRGGSPIEHALINNDKKTGISIIKLTSKMDAGPIYLKKEIEIEATDTKDSLTEKLSTLGSKTLLEALVNLKKLKPIPQNEKEVSFAYILKFNQQFLDFSQKASLVDAKIRALYLEPGAFLKHQNILVKVSKADILEKKSLKPGHIKVLKDALLIGCSDYYISILELQQEGKKKLAIKSYLNGQKLFKDDSYLTN